MSSTLTTAGQSLLKINQRYETITHNMANANTSGYKRRFTVFSSLLNNRMYGDANANVNPDDPKARKVNTSPMTIDFSQGMLNQTGRKLDIGISGKAFFGLETPNGTLYSRSGSLHIGMGQKLVDSLGRMVAGESGPISIPPNISENSISIADDGTVSAGGNSLGKIKLVEFQDESKLTPVGGSCFTIGKTVKPLEAKNSKINQGFLERSNVTMVEELVDLISVSRLYEANVKIAKSQDESTGNILRLAMS